MSSKKLSLLIPLDMHRALKRQALESDTTISSIIQELIVRYLSENGVSTSPLRADSGSQPAPPDHP